MRCNYCNSADHSQIQVKEMRNGSREIFNYSYCSNCESLVLHDKPQNIGDYYSNYYTSTKNYHKLSLVRNLLWKIRSFLSVNISYSLISKISYNTILEWAHLTGISFNSNILDVGCGNGDILYEFHKHGFKYLNGIDPFPAQNSETPKNIKLRKGYLADLTNEKFDLIMFNHSFEHMDEHEKTLKLATRLLNHNGKILIRMPIINEAFRIYKNNWVQIDAPRHFILHSEKSFKLLTEKVGLKIEEVFFDSTAFQFLGSIQNEKDISFYQMNSYQVDKGTSIFSKEDFDKYEKLAIEYNDKRIGDQAGFILKLNQ